MDAEFLKQIEQFANLKTALNVKKRNAVERANNKLIFAIFIFGSSIEILFGVKK